LELEWNTQNSEDMMLRRRSLWWSSVAEGIGEGE